MKNLSPLNLQPMKKGDFELFAPFGTVTIEPYLEGHEFEYVGSSVFSKESKFIGQISNDITGLFFSNTTTRSLTICMLGGDASCNASIGSGYVNLQTPSACYNKYFEIGSDPMSYKIPLLVFNMKVDVFNNNENHQWNWEGDEEFINFEEFMVATKQYNSLKVREVDATSEDTNATFRYHSIVTEDKIEVKMDQAITIDSNCSGEIAAVR